MHWSIYALLSAVFAALVAIFGKLGLKDIDSTLATTVRSIVMALFLVGVSITFGKFSFLDTLDKKAITFIVFSGVAGALSWLFYFFAIKGG
ncbi:MAG: EamA family transporter, partial [Patescibacteria group bacterium]